MSAGRVGHLLLLHLEGSQVHWESESYRNMLRVGLSSRFNVVAFSFCTDWAVSDVALVVVENVAGGTQVDLCV